MSGVSLLEGREYLYMKVISNNTWVNCNYTKPLPVSTILGLFQEKHEEDKCRLRITFFNESSGDETQWLVTMETEAGVTALVEAVRDPWEEAYGVEMDVEVSAFELSF